MLLPDIDRILLGPGPSMTSPRVMRAMAAPTVSHLDPIMIAMLDDVRSRLVRLFRAPEGSFALAISGTGTSGMETAVANLVADGTRVLGRRHRLFRRSAGADVRALRRDGAAGGRRVGPGLRSGSAAALRWQGSRRRHRRDGARGDVDRRAEPGRASWRRSRASRAR